MMEAKFVLGDRVVKTKGDYVYQGIIVSVFRKITGAVRYVVENNDGVLMIMNEQQLELDID